MSARVETSLSAQLDRMERARVVRESDQRLRDSHVTMSHGSGGKAMHGLIERLILPAFRNPALDVAADSAVFGVGSLGDRLAFTTDSYVVSPLFFPGGDIGKLAVHGTINDLAMAGARPLALSVGFILEEGLEMDVLRRVVDSISAAARATGVPIVTGDTKVVPRGKADQLFVNTSGVGAIKDDVRISADSVEDGDVVLLSGSVGDHGMAVMLAREALDLESEIESDSAPLHALVERLLDAAPHTRMMKDPTRGGLATTLNEIARRAGVTITIDETCIPVRPSVRGACEILGLDPLQIANEGKLVAVVPAHEAEAALEAMRADPLGREATRIGSCAADAEHLVLLRTAIGGVRVLDMLVGDPLPRIC